MHCIQVAGDTKMKPGCRGSNGVPELYATSLPKIGGQLRVAVRNARPRGVAVLLNSFGPDDVGT